MSRIRNRLLLASATIVFAGVLLHLAIPFGGPAWYTFFGAPAHIIAAAKVGSFRPAISCVVIAGFLAVVGFYALSGAGAIRRLPLLRSVLGLIGLVLLARGLSFIPLAAFRPQLLAGICGRCQTVSIFLVATSALCLFVGASCAFAALRVRI